jgi:hypothetical protein
VFPAVKIAASRYDPGHESGAAFPTFALKHIQGAVARIVMDSPPLAGPIAASGDPEVQPQEELHPEEESLDLADIMASVREHRRSDIIESVYQATRFPDEYSSEELRQAAALIEEQFAEELEQDAKLRALHSNLIVMSIRAESFVGSMVPIGTLWHILAVREYRRARGMPAEKYSSKALARVFGRPSPNTLTRWLRKCDEEGITVQNWTPAQLAKIISSRRGPKFRGRLELPTSRPDE